MASRNVERLLNVIMTIGSRSRIDRRRLFAVIPEYAEASSLDAAEKMFERDKNAIRDLGLPLRSERDPWDESVVHYRLDTDTSGEDLELSDGEYTVLLAASRAWDDAAAGGAARRVRAKLLSQGPEADSDLLRRTPRGTVESLPVLTPLLEAVTTGVRVDFAYRSAAGERSERSVEPWIVGVQHGHWYLVGFDRRREDMRVFKATRIESFPSLGAPAAVARPAGLTLDAALEGVSSADDLAAARASVEPYKALALRDAAGVALDAREVMLPRQNRAAAMRQVLSQSRWVTILEPTAWRDALAAVLEEIARTHKEPVDEDLLRRAPVRESARIRRPRSGADDLSRLISLASYVLRRGEVELSVVAAEFGVSEAQLIEDLQVLFLCGDLGTGWEDFIEAEWEDGFVRVRNAEPLRRPLRLSAAEATALLAGLAALEPVAGEEGVLVASAREKLRARLGSSADSLEPLQPVTARGGAEVGVDGQGTMLSREETILDAVHRAIREEDGLVIRYSPPDRPGTSVRRIRPALVETTGGRPYVLAHCELVGAERRFRVDRIAEILPEGTPQHHEDGPGASPSADGEATTPSGRLGEDAWVRLEGPAMWIAEAFSATQRRDHPDGGTFALLPDPFRSALVDAVLEASGAAEVIAPAGLRDLIVMTAEHGAARHSAAKAIS